MQTRIWRRFVEFNEKIVEIPVTFVIHLECRSAPLSHPLPVGAFAIPCAAAPPRVR